MKTGLIARWIFSRRRNLHKKKKIFCWKTLIHNGIIARVVQSEDSGFVLVVDLDIKVEGLSQEDAEKMVATWHKACPYPKAIKGNVDVTIKVVAVR
jgi:organic hydroperoxide reductase OsmC/OhrA